MQKANLYLIATGIAAGVLSMVYFLSLVMSIPFLLIVPVICFAIYVVYKIAGQTETIDLNDGTWLAVPIYLLFFLGVAGIVYRTYSVAEFFGGWDAWAIWNLQAKYMISPEHWKKLLLNTRFGHPDYPLLVPGINAFFARLYKGNYLEMISFITGFCITLFIPVIIYIETCPKNVLIAAGSFLLFINSKFFILMGVSGYADAPLAFFLLGAIVCLRYTITGGRSLIVMTGFLIGCCLWTKNEGLIVGAIFVLFNFKSLLLNGNYRHFLGGLLLPVIVLAIFKIGYAPPGDMISGLKTETLNQLFAVNRYEMIYRYMVENLSKKFYYPVIGVLGYLMVRLVEGKWPARQFAMLLTCFAAYFMVYVLTGQGLEWHLHTSQDRLILQLMPSVVYISADGIASFLKMRTTGRKLRSTDNL